jgi:Fic family protein
MKYIHQLPCWPAFSWDTDAIGKRLAEVRHRQGRLLGRMDALGFEARDEAVLRTLTLDVVKSSEIEGDVLDPKHVRSSLAKRLGMDIGALLPADRHTDGVVEMVLDAVQRYGEPLDNERLFSLQSSLFPGGRSGMRRIIVGAWRDDHSGPMQVVSGAHGRENVHFEAPAADRIEREMKSFLSWCNKDHALDPVLKAAIAHLWFVTIHPFEDGNGRIARALTDMFLARAEDSDRRFYSISARIRTERTKYYEILETTQRCTKYTPASIDITAWLSWFLDCLDRAVSGTDEALKTVLKKADFWQRHAENTFNERQRIMLNRLYDGFEGKLTSSKWALIAKCSQDTAHRDIVDLIERGILAQDGSGGRSTGYVLV